MLIKILCTRKKKARIEFLNEQIQNEYEIGPTNLVNYDRQFFQHPLATTLKKDKTPNDNGLNQFLWHGYALISNKNNADKASPGNGT
jgi:hypothetical protein